MSPWRIALTITLLAGVSAAQPLPGTEPLTWSDDLSVRMMDGAHRFVERKIAESARTRMSRWKRDASSPAAYIDSVAGNRERFVRQIGAVDTRLPPEMERFGSDGSPALLAETPVFRAWQARWPVLEGVDGEGLLLEPKRAPAAYIVVLPDADQTPEQVSGLAAGIPLEAQMARRLAESGCVVIVPTLIDRSARWSGRPEIRMTEQPHREWIYRQAYHMGRHVIGYEVQKTLAAVDWIRSRHPAARVGIAGYGEGGLIAFYAAAADTRIDAAWVNGYFDSRQAVWREPIYRNVWALTAEFGDAEIASLIAPRSLLVELRQPPLWKDSKGEIAPLDETSVRGEFARIDTLLPAGFQKRALATTGAEALRQFLGMLNAGQPGPSSAFRPGAVSTDPAARQQRQVKQLEGHVQRLVEASEDVRSRFFLYKVAPEFADETWSTRVSHPTLKPERFIEAAKWYREYFAKELMGRFEEPALPLRARTRQIYDTPRYTGYDVVIDLWPEVFAWGVLLVPKGIPPGERRPVVVCQHGRNGLPKDTIENEDTPYRRFAARLAERGFVTFSPHNLYRGEDRYRWLCRKANNVRATLFSFIIAQHGRILDWLETLPFVDNSRMAFYGLSYGGETAVRVPALLEKYCLSICSGDFNNWTRKVASTSERFSFMYTIEWEMPYFNLGSTFDYAEMAYLMLPRPFMAERGHHDRVGRDRWVAYEYAKVRWLYTQFDMPERTEIEYFNGGHAIHGEGTFAFLERFLKGR